MRRDHDFERALAEVINRFSKEGGSNSPDFVLAAYLASCLDAYNHAVFSRTTFHGNQACKAVTLHTEKASDD